jgi:sulfonate transport system substrate-binding protein
VKVDQLAEQQRIADFYYESRLIPKPLKISDIAVWVPQGK